MFVKFHVFFGEKKNRKMWKIENLREKNVEIMGKNNSPIIMTLIHGRTYGTHKKLPGTRCIFSNYTFLLVTTIFGPIHYGPP